jgi:hypothetical protein
VVEVYPAAADPMAGDPQSNGQWQGATWHELTGALNDPRSGPGTRAAMLYDAKNLYVAFVSDNEPPAGRDDSVELWLDSSAAGDGRELFSVSVKRDGATSGAWYRAQQAASPKPDGSPDTAHIVNVMQRQVKGLEVASAAGSADGKPVWTVVIKLPLGGLPGPLATQGKVGDHWRVNLLRYDLQTGAGGEPIVIQSNLAPIYQASQPLSPYRMAEVVLEAPHSAGSQ